MNILAFARENHVAKEIADNLNKKEIQMALELIRKVKSEAETINDQALWFEYDLLPHQIEEDINTCQSNIREFQKALNMKRNEPIQYFGMNPIYLN
jgi:hypothetical protein